MVQPGATVEQWLSRVCAHVRVLPEEKPVHLAARDPDAGRPDQRPASLGCC